MKIRLLIFCCLLGWCVWAQNNAPLTQLKKHKVQDTTRCYLLNAAIEAENDQNIWIVYNRELRKIAVEKLKSEKNPLLRKTYTRYLSVSYNNDGAFELYAEHYGKAIGLYKKSLAVSSGINDHYGSSLALQNIGTAYDYLGKIDSSLVYMKKAYQYAVRSKNTAGIAYVLTDLGYIYNNLGNNTLAVKYNLMALPLFEKLKDSEGLERTYFSLGRIFDNQNDYKSSIPYYLKCLDIDQKNKNYERLALVWSALAAAHTHQNLLDKALHFNNEAFKLASKMQNTDLVAASHKNYGDIYFRKNEGKKAKTHYLKALEILKTIGNLVPCSKINTKLAEICFQQNQLSAAKTYGLQSFALAEKTNFPSDKKNAAEMLGKVFAKAKDFENAYKFKSIASDISEKIYFDESKDIALKATYRYETEKKEATIKNLNQEKKIAKLESNKKSILINSIVISFLALALIAYFLFSRFRERKKNELLQNQLAEAEKLLEAEKKITDSELKALKSQMNPHFIFNALNSIQEQFMYGDKMKANEQLSNFTYLTRQILEVSGKKQITVATEIELLTKYLELEKMRFAADFDYQIKVSETIDEDYHKLPPMLLQPFVENSIKHGLMHKKGPKNISIDFDLDEEEAYLICTITDNGIGREKSAAIKAGNASNHNSFSTQSIEQRLALLNEKLQLEELVTYQDLTEKETVSGTRVIVNIPLG